MPGESLIMKSFTPEILNSAGEMLSFEVVSVRAEHDQIFIK